MRRNCNLELQLLPSSSSFPIRDSDHHHHHRRHNNHRQQEQEQQQLTIFYNGRVCVSDVTEFKARAIIWLASREMEETMKSGNGSNGSNGSSGSEPNSPSEFQSHIHSPTGLSMKRSLQRFLQKRKDRIQATFPYNH